MRNQTRESACRAQQGVAGDSVSDFFTGIAVLLSSELQAGSLCLRKHFERYRIASEEARAHCEFDVAEAEWIGIRVSRGRCVCFTWSAEPKETHDCEISCCTIERGRAGIKAELVEDGH
jgi:hypothetical protein